MYSFFSGAYNYEPHSKKETTMSLILIQERYIVRKTNEDRYEIYDRYLRQKPFEQVFTDYKSARIHCNRLTSEYFNMVKWAVQPNQIGQQLDSNIELF